MAVLEGMGDVLRRNPQLKLITEFNPEALRKCGADPPAYLTALDSHGFTIYRIGEDGETMGPVAKEEFPAMRGGEAFANLLCTRENLVGNVAQSPEGFTVSCRRLEPRGAL